MRAIRCGYALNTIISGSSPAQQAMHYPHVALRWAGLQVLPVAQAFRGAGFQPAWRHSSPPLSGAGRSRWCAGTNLLQQYLYAQGSHACLTD